MTATLLFPLASAATAVIAAIGVTVAAVVASAVAVAASAVAVVATVATPALAVRRALRVLPLTGLRLLPVRSL